MAIAFDPESIDRYDWTHTHMDYDPHGQWVEYEEYENIKSLLHDIESDADPAGTHRELRLAQDTIKALEARVAELEEQLKGEGNG